MGEGRKAIYIRWSTDEQGDGTTLEVQRDRCLKLAGSKGWAVADEDVFIDDGYSGGNLNRPALKRLRELVQKGEIDSIIVFKLDRLSRNLVDAVNLAFHEWKGKCNIRSVEEAFVDTTTGMGEMLFGMLMSFASYELSSIRVRLRSGILMRFQQGQRAGAVCPYGYQPVMGKPGHYVEHPDHARVVRMIFEWIDTEPNIGTPGVSRRLNDMGIAPPGDRHQRFRNGKTLRWHQTSVRHIVENAIYKGELRYGVRAVNPERQKDASKPWNVKREKPLVVAAAQTVPALVDPDLWDRVRQKMTARARQQRHTSGRGMESPHLLVGTARCICGGPLSIRYAKNWDKSRRNRYYQCYNRVSQGEAACPHDPGHIPADAVERAVTADLLKYLQECGVTEELRAENAWSLSGRFTASDRQRIRTFEEQVQNTRKILERIPGRREALARDRAMGEIDKDEWRTLKAALDKEEDRLLTLLREQEQALAEESLGALEAERLRQLIETSAHWDDLTAIQRKAIVRDLTESIVIFKPKGSGHLPSVNVTWKAL